MSAQHRPPTVDADQLALHADCASCFGLCRANLRGALLIAADLRDADLRTAGLTGTDFRGADLCGTDLTGSIFLTQAQVNAAKGDATTRLPEPLLRPAHRSTTRP